MLLDVKRGDIGSTVAAYADAYLDPASPLCADAITVSPYLGVGSLRAVFDLAAAHGGGVFVLALTSNPEGAAVQHAVAPPTAGPSRRRSSTRFPSSTRVRRRSAASGWWSARRSGRPVTTCPRVNGPLLAPGLGAQGATPADLRAVFGDKPARGAAVVLPGGARRGPGSGRAAGRRGPGADDCRAALGWPVTD